ncbi:MAG: hypothetical protein RLY61_130 [Candidatus Parcubacteria bacterium]|jgi:hypothetical protein
MIATYQNRRVTRLVYTSKQESLLDVVPYGLKEGATLSPEQKDVIFPALTFCSEFLQDGEEAILLGSRALAPYILTTLTDPEEASRYLAGIGKRDLDLHLCTGDSYARALPQLNVTSAGYPYGARGQYNDTSFDIVNNGALGKAYIGSIGRVLELVSERTEIKTAQAKIWLDELRNGNTEAIIPLTRVYTLSSLGVRIKRVDGGIEATVYDPLGLLDKHLTSNNVVEPINVNSVRFLFLELVGETRFEGSPYTTGLKQIPDILMDPEIREIAHSALGELPTIIKTLLTHNLSMSHPHLRTIYSVTRLLARIDPEVAVDNPLIAIYVKNVQAILANKVEDFTDCMALMLQDFPLGWCIYPMDMSSRRQVANRQVQLNRLSPANDETFTRLAELTEQVGNPLTLEAALGMYLAVEVGRRHPSNSIDQVQRRETVEIIYNWWRKNYPALVKTEILQFFNYYDSVLIGQMPEEIATIQA